MANAERMEPTGESSSNLNRTDTPPPSPCKNSSDLYQFQERPLATCPPQRWQDVSFTALDVHKDDSYSPEIELGHIL